MTKTEKTKLYNLARKIKLIAMDIDGVLTAGDIIVLDDGQEVKSWNVKDRIAFHFAKQYKTGLRFAWVTGRGSKQIQIRAKEIGIDVLYQNVMRKGTVGPLCDKFKITPDEIAYIGDDLIDMPLLEKVGLAVCPADAAAEVKRLVDWVSDIPGGKGILRAVVELVLRSQGKWEKIVKEYSS